jgi:signal peptidase II
MRWGASLSPGVDEPGFAQPPDAAEPAVNISVPARAFGLFWWITALTVVLDQLTKLLVDWALPVYSSRTIIPNVLDLVHVHNAGVAFGLLNAIDDPRRAMLTTGLAVVALIGIAYYARHVRSDEKLARVGLSLILGGAIGNLIDRLRQGYVIDFVDVYWGDWHFWAFNVADAAISVGATLVFVEVLFFNRHASHPV